MLAQHLPAVLLKLSILFFMKKTGLIVIVWFTDVSIVCCYLSMWDFYRACVKRCFDKKRSDLVGEWGYSWRHVSCLRYYFLCADKQVTSRYSRAAGKYLFHATKILLILPALHGMVLYTANPTSSFIPLPQNHKTFW